MKKSYRVNGRDGYQIEYRRQSDGTIKMFAPTRPRDPYGAPVTENHLYPSGQICVAQGQEPKSMERATAIAVHFMEGYSEYVRTGTFPKGGRRVKV